MCFPMWKNIQTKEVHLIDLAALQALQKRINDEEMEVTLDLQDGPKTPVLSGVIALRTRVMTLVTHL